MKLEVFKSTKTGLEVFFRPIEISDRSLVENFTLTLSEQSLRRRFLTSRKDIYEEYLNKFFLVNSDMEMKILVLVNQNNREEVVGVGQFHKYLGTALAEVALVISDKYQDKGIGRELLTHMVQIAKQSGLKGFEGIVQIDNRPILHLCATIGFGALEKINRFGVYELKMYFDKNSCPPCYIRVN